MQYACVSYVSSDILLLLDFVVLEILANPKSHKCALRVGLSRLTLRMGSNFCQHVFLYETC